MIKLNTLTNGELVNIDFSAWNFPAGEFGVKLPKVASDDMGFCITWHYENDAEFMQVANIVNAIRKTYTDSAMIDLLVPYLPYARQDRVCHEGEAFGLKVFANLLNSLNLDNVVSFDVHSEIAKSVINNFTNIDQFICARDLPKYDFVIAPDAGAAKKINQLSQVNDIENPTQVITLEKHRFNGKVSHILPKYLPDIVGKKVCVVDDICDGGATFISVGNLFKELMFKPAKLDLYVTHGIFSKGTDELLKIYDTIYTCNLMNKSVAKSVTQLIMMGD